LASRSTRPPTPWENPSRGWRATPPLDQSNESFWLERIHDSGERERVHVFTVALDAPNISTFVVTIGPDLAPGLYELKTTRTKR
jgi:hypothetical protein